MHFLRSSWHPQSRRFTDNFTALKETLRTRSQAHLLSLQCLGKKTFLKSACAITLFLSLHLVSACVSSWHLLAIFFPGWYPTSTHKERKRRKCLATSVDEIARCNEHFIQNQTSAKSIRAALITGSISHMRNWDESNHGESSHPVLKDEHQLTSRIFNTL